MKKKLVIITIASMLLLSVIILALLYANPIFEKIDNKYIENIKEYYSLELPENGQVTLYEADRGELLEIYINKRYYADVTNQLVENMYTEPYTTDLEMLYGLEDRDIEGVFYIEKRLLGENTYGYDPDHIYISGIEKGKFRILIELRGIECE